MSSQSPVQVEPSNIGPMVIEASVNPSENHPNNNHNNNNPNNTNNNNNNDNENNQSEKMNQNFTNLSLDSSSSSPKNNNSPRSPSPPPTTTPTAATGTAAPSSPSPPSSPVPPSNNNNQNTTTTTNPSVSNPPTVAVNAPNQDEEEKPQNTKQLPQIDQSPDLIARIVKGIRVAAQAIHQEANPQAQSVVVQTPSLAANPPASPPSARTSSLSFSLTSRPFSFSSPPANSSSPTTQPTQSNASSPMIGASTSPSFSTTASTSMSSTPTTSAPSTFSFSSSFSSPQYSPLVMSAISESGLRLGDFTRETARKYMIDGTEVKDFAPLVFMKIREMTNVSTDQYIKSWTIPVEKLQMSHGAGRSGSLFLKSDDKRFLLKTIPHDELETFLTILPNYFQHVRDNPSSLIMRVVGLLRIKETFTSWIYIIIFTNILFTDFLEIDEIYDLKGRVPKPGKQGRNKGKKGIVFKDNDLERVFYLTEEHHFIFMQTIQADIEFLARNNIMDYSFLIGVAKLKSPDDRQAIMKALPENIQQISMFRRMDGGIEANSGDEFYLMGIIDCLTDYSTKKKIAHAMKLTLWNPATLSTVDALMYSQRILKFIRAIFPEPE